MSDVPLTHCPLCQATFDPSCVDWRCPACEHDNIGVNVLQTCANCRFGPRLLPCRSCGHCFELLRIFGTFDGSGSEVRPFAEVADGAKYPYVLRDLRGCFLNEQVSIDAERVKSEVGASLTATICVPDAVEDIALHTIHRSTDGRVWVHAWLMASGSANLSDPYAQVSVRVAGLDPPDVFAVVTDIRTSAVCRSAADCGQSHSSDGTHDLGQRLRRLRYRDSDG